MFQKQRAEPLVDKVSNIGKDLLAQFHGQQTRTHRRTEFGFKRLDYIGWQIGLLPKQSQ
jgi:hypothetical protein